MFITAFLFLPLVTDCSVLPPQENSDISESTPCDLESRIYYGDPAKITDYPFYAATEGCGGAIISSSWVVTAAHCVDSDLMPQSSYSYVWVGGASYNNSKKVRVQKVIIHPYYHFNENRVPVNDIALLKLKTKLKFSSSIQPIKLPKKSDKFTRAGYVFVGRGIDETGFQAKQLQMSKMTRYKASECYYRYYADPHAWYRPVLPSNPEALDSAVLCTIREKDMPKICNGDSGSPLVKDGVLIGLGSHSHGDCDKHAPSFLANVQNYVGWILAQIKK